MFQCSSASRKFLNLDEICLADRFAPHRFSALQRAENSSIRGFAQPSEIRFPFQCSSASRKFLNGKKSSRFNALSSSFSALQRAENSSICAARTQSARVVAVSVLFSEPKIPQSFHQLRVARRADAFQCSSASRKFLNFDDLPKNIRIADVSVLFSEPKIPQSYTRDYITRAVAAFQCSSASRKFLNLAASAEIVAKQLFQCSSASRKFLNAAPGAE